MLKLHKVKFGYDKGPYYFADFSVEHNHILLITGPNGSGKTTLLKTIAGITQCFHGDVLMNNKNLNDIVPYNRPITFMFQDFSLFPGLSVKENLEMIPGIKPQAVINALKEFDLLDTINMKSRQLSSGQQQAITLLRCFLHNQPLWLLDEPTSHMAQPLAEKFIQKLALYAKTSGHVVVVVTHNEKLFEKYTNDCRDISSIVQSFNGPL